MDSSEPEHEDHTESTRPAQDPMMDKFTPPGVVHTSDEDALFYGDDYEEDYEEDYMSEDNDGKPSHYNILLNFKEHSTANKSLSKITRLALLIKPSAAHS